MKIPISWLKDFVEIDLPLDELAKVMTMIGLEVEEVQLVGLPLPEMEHHEFKFTGLSWERDKIVVAQIDEVMPHPNAERLVLCRLLDGEREHTVLTGAPNLYEYKGKGPLPKPIKVAYAREGARLYDGHAAGLEITTLKRTKIRGVESYSMVCSEKELGISEDHEGIIVLDDDAPTGMPLVDYMGDAVYTISILPNMIRNACVLGVAREIAAKTGKTLKMPKCSLPWKGAPVKDCVSIEITDPKLNPRFTVGLIRGVKAQPSPYLIQRRLRLAGMRPINSVVDATNYVMLEVNQPLHAFDYDTLLKRAAGKKPKIITRAAYPNEKLKTLDGVDRALNEFTIMVTDTAGSLSLAGVMGGEESEVTPETSNVLLEAASWNFINTRRTMQAQRLSSEAGYRYSRGLHPEVNILGLKLGLERMGLWSGGEIAEGIVDEYPQKQIDPLVSITSADVKRLLGIEMNVNEMAKILEPLGFVCRIEGNTLHAQTPADRVDIGEGVIGKADLIEEIARMHGFDNIPGTRMADPLPPQRSNPALEFEERLRDILCGLGLQDIYTYRLTEPGREARLYPKGSAPELAYTRLLNPIAAERSVMRRSVLAAVLEVLERNIRLRQRLAFYEIGPVFIPVEGQQLPDEPVRLAIAMSGLRGLPAWDTPQTQMIDFYDLKGIFEGLFEALHISSNVVYEPAGDLPTYHPGKCARVKVGDVEVGVLGKLHPLVKENFDLLNAPVLVAEVDVDALRKAAGGLYIVKSVPVFPPVLEDLAVVVDETLPAEQVAAVIRKSAGKLLADLRLFDIYRGEKIGAGKKSLAYSLTYQSADRTLTDSEVTKARQRVLRALEQDLGAKLRS
jgi:phenylalanyl-tRNA synthetase beta chain